MYHNTRNHNQRPRQQTATVSLKQVEIDRADSGARRLFRSEVNGKPTGFVEKYFKGDELVREFALGGILNGVTEAQAKARFKGVAEVAKPSVEVGLPDFLTNPEPVMKGKSAQARKPAPAPKPVARKTQTTESKGRAGFGSRKEGLAMAGSVLTRKS